MESFWYRYRNPLVLAALVLAQIVLLATQVRRTVPEAADGHEVRLARVWAMESISPFERVFHWFGRSVRNTWGGYVWLRHTRDENAQLRTEVQRLRLEEAALTEDAQQGQRLQRLLGFKEHYPADLVTAQVIGTSGSEQSKVLYLDKGSKDGVAADMPVITPDGVVGKIRDVGPHTSQVLEISDQTSGAGIMLERTRIRGVLRGNALGQPEIINMLPDDRIQPGERVLTSGGDQVFPRGLLVGTVDRVVTDPERDPYVAILVAPSANLQRLEEVLVITSQADAQPASMAKDLAAAQVTAAQQRAAQVLAEKLPTVDKTADVVSAEGELDQAVAKPVNPVHADVFTAGATKPASEMTPGTGEKPAEGVVEDAAKKPASKTESGVLAAMAPATVDAPKPVTTVHVEDDGTLTVTTKNADGSKVIVHKKEDGTVLSTKKVAAPPAPVVPKPAAPVTDAAKTGPATGTATGTAAFGAKPTGASGSTTAAAGATTAASTANSNVWWANDDGTKTYVTINADGSKTLTRKAADGTVVSTRKVVPGATSGATANAASTGAAKPAAAANVTKPATNGAKPAASVTKPATNAGAKPAATGAATPEKPPVLRAPATGDTGFNAAVPRPATPKSATNNSTAPKNPNSVPKADFGVVGDK